MLNEEQSLFHIYIVIFCFMYRSIELKKVIVTSYIINVLQCIIKLETNLLYNMFLQTWITQYYSGGESKRSG